jgi:hydrogenase nickel incorporation protein HypA/HybF
MHEWALAESVIETVKQNVDEKNLKHVKSVTLLFGELQDVDKDIFTHGLHNMLLDSDLDEGVFSIEIEPALFHCNVCDEEWTLKAFPLLSEDQREAIHFLPEAAHVYIQCTNCGSPDFSVTRGRGVTIKSIEMEVDS